MRIDLNEKGFCLDGEPTILLTASLFYFRIPRMLCHGKTASRSKGSQVQCHRCYFPWNYHEPREGCWDFSGEKDVAAFLDLASEARLKVPALISVANGMKVPCLALSEEWPGAEAE